MQSSTSATARINYTNLIKTTKEIKYVYNKFNRGVAS